MKQTVSGEFWTGRLGNETGSAWDVELGPSGGMSGWSPVGEGWSVTALGGRSFCGQGRNWYHEAGMFQRLVMVRDALCSSPS